MSATNRLGSYPVCLDSKMRSLQYIYASDLQSWDIHTDLVEYGTSDSTFNEDYSAAATHAVYTPTTNVIISRLSLYIVDSNIVVNAPVNDWEKWIGNAAELTNGIQIRIMDSTCTTTVLDITQSNIKTLGHLANLSSFFETVSYTGSGVSTANSHSAIAHFNFPELYGGCSIGIQEGQCLSVLLQDNFSDLHEFSLTVHGRVIYP